MSHIDRITQMTIELQKKNAQFFEKQYESNNVASWDMPTWGKASFTPEVDNFHKANFMVRQIIAGKTVELYVPLNKFPKRLLFVLWLLGFKVRVKK